MPYTARLLSFHRPLETSRIMVDPDSRAAGWLVGGVPTVDSYYPSAGSSTQRIGLANDFGYHEPATTGYQAQEYERRLEQQRLDRLYAIRSVRRAIIRGADPAELLSRSEIIERDNRKCYLCGAGDLADNQIHLDHVVPLARGGSHTAANLRVACAPCNMSKGSRLLEAS